MNMKMIGKRQRAIAPTTIFVFKRAPNCSRLLSVQSLSAVRTRMRLKTRKAAVIKLDTANNAIMARQLFGSNGTSSDPNVNTAARSKARSIPPTVRAQRCLASIRLMTWPLTNHALQGSSWLENHIRGEHFSSAAARREQYVSILSGNTSLWHDSQRAEASQDFYLSSSYSTCPCGQVLAISERLKKF